MQAGCLRAISETRSKQTRVIGQIFIYQLELLCGLVRPRSYYAPIHNLSLDSYNFTRNKTTRFTTSQVTIGNLSEIKENHDSFV